MPQFLDITHKSDEQAARRCQELVSDSAAHCSSLLSWLGSYPQTQLTDPQPGCAGKRQGKPVVQVYMPASWETASQQGVQALAAVCSHEVNHLQQLLWILNNAGKNGEAAARAAVELHSLEIRLASAKAAIQAWLQAEQQPALGANFPISPYQLDSTADALRLYEALLVAEMQWARLSFIASNEAVAPFAKVCWRPHCRAQP